MTKIVKAYELPVHGGADCAGGAGRKLFLTVEYLSPDLANLHTELFVKLPWEPDWHMRGELSLGLGDGDGLEIATYVYLEHLLPCHVPKYYFGDIDRSSTNYVLVTERVPYAARGADPEAVPPYALRPACGKYEDFKLAKPEAYYKSLFRTMGRVAAWDKRGRFDEHMEIFDQMKMTQRVAGLAGDAWKPRQRTSEGKYVAATPERAAGTRKALGAIIDAGLKFVNEVAPFLCEPAVLDPAFQARFKAQMLDALVFAGLVGKFGANDSKFVGLTHTNLQLDNAYFWTADDGSLECGLLDWYMCSRTAMAQVWLGCLSGADGECLAGHDLAIFRAFSDEHEAFGGPRVPPEELLERFTLNFPSYIIGNISKIETHILSEVPVEKWKGLTSKEDVLDGPWNARCFSLMIANGLSYWYHKGDDHPGAVMLRWAAKHDLVVGDAV